MDYSLILPGLALALSLVALVRCYVPPQRRDVLDLTGRVEDLEHAHEDVRQRLTKRAKQENMEKARSTHEQNAAERDALAEHARTILAQQAQASLPLQAPSNKADLRRKFGLIK